MSRDFIGDMVKAFAEEEGISLEAARSRKRRGSESWRKFEAKHAPKRSRARKPVATGSTLVRYRALEEETHRQLTEVQAQLDGVIASGDAANLRIYVQGVKDLANTFNECVKLRQLAEVQEGLILPAEVLDRYKSQFYPRLEAGVEEMRMAIEARLPTHMRADFAVAWQESYRRYQDAAREAEAGIEGVRTEAQSAASKALNLTKRK